MKGNSDNLRYNLNRFTNHALESSHLLTKTMLDWDKILQIYRNNDLVQKALIGSKYFMVSLLTYTAVGKIHVRAFLSILGYAIIVVIASRFGLTYIQAV